MKVPRAALLALSLLTIATAASAADTCGQPVTSGPAPAASDALAVLRSAVGSFECQVCVCDVDESGAVTASDALRVLRVAVGQNFVLDCTGCFVEQVIGAAGGSITSLDNVMTLVVPPGALGEDTAIRIQDMDIEDLPEPLASSDEDARVYLLGPEGLELDEDVQIRVRQTEDPTATPGMLVGDVGIVFTGDGEDGIAMAGNQGLEVDRVLDTVTTTATISRLAFVAALVLDVRMSIADLPTAAPLNVPLQIGIEIENDDEAVTFDTATYTDDDFGAWGPSSGVAIEQDPITPVGDSFSESYGYQCSGSALVSYSPRIDMQYDLDVEAETPLAFENITHRTDVLANVNCQP
ncbi:MAG TPA: hypothetical protein VEC57_17130 [Candidatus Limnocylindrales bacterium]|nr:hypothetical protein [Candidatus Limnocylindrales bacterium]